MPCGELKPSGKRCRRGTETTWFYHNGTQRCESCHHLAVVRDQRDANRKEIGALKRRLFDEQCRSEEAEKRLASAKARHTAHQKDANDVYKHLLSLARVTKADLEALKKLAPDQYPDQPIEEPRSGCGIM